MYTPSRNLLLFGSLWQGIPNHFIQVPAWTPLYNFGRKTLLLEFSIFAMWKRCFIISAPGWDEIWLFIIIHAILCHRDLHEQFFDLFFLKSVCSISFPNASVIFSKADYLFFRFFSFFLSLCRTCAHATTLKSISEKLEKGV